MCAPKLLQINDCPSIEVDKIYFREYVNSLTENLFQMQDDGKYNLPPRQPTG